ncbi:glycosyltransferase 87 family protein [Rhodococcus sp. B10]|uniref:glycosyltransferase family 87 protein n=1 Tax=Rhodococcus sp. B10 TaxID=2695876 RepID=UPI001980A9ED|nr:glycosyltransferase 87 family protein [Rhodococcus sp. B10]
MRSGVRTSPATMIAVVTLCAFTLILGYLNKARCAVAPFDDDGRSTAFDAIKDSSVCYSDIQFLWLGRDINNHVFPYLDGAITSNGVLTGGTVEYPVLSGVLMWLGAIPSHTDAEFLLWSALLLAPFGLLTAWMLGRLAGRAAFLWSAGPPLVMYAFHNWELPVVAAAVGAVFVMASRLPLRTRAVLASVLLAIGFCLKLYPGAFVLPLAAYVVYEGGRGRWDFRGGLAVLGAAAATVVAINLPFALGGYEGWRASFVFQSLRQADITTNSIWYWGVRHFYITDSMTADDYEHAEASFQNTVDILSPLLVFAAFGLALILGLRRARLDGMYPWIAVSGSMLCGFLLFHKVHSPQYTLWLVPFFVLLRVPWGVVVAYLVADLSMGIGVFKYFAALAAGSDATTEQFFVEVGVWGRACLLVVLFFLFARARLRFDGAPTTSPPPAPEIESTPASATS